jgi:hypothetical protein
VKPNEKFHPASRSKPEADFVHEPNQAKPREKTPFIPEGERA